MRGLTKVLAVGIAMSFMVGAFALMPANAGNTENDWMVDIGAGVPATVTFYDVEWRPDGRWAMFVGMDTNAPAHGCAWAYDTQTGTWVESTPVGGITDGQSLNAVMWDPTNSFFVVAGDASSAGEWFSAPIAGAMSAFAHPASFASMVINDLCVGPGTTIYACGSNPGGVGILLAADRTSYASGWTSVATSVESASTYNAMIYRAIDDTVYLVGSYNAGSLSLVDKVTTGVWSPFGVGTGIQCVYTDVIEASGTIRVTASGRGSDVPAVWEANLPLVSTWVGIANPPQLVNFNALDIGYAGKMICVGSMSGNGVIYDGGTTKRTDDALLAAHPLFDVACRPTGIPMALTAGSSFKYSYMAVDGGITVNTVYPHIGSLNMYNQNSAVSVINGAVDVDPGTDTNWYTVFLQGSYDIVGGATNVDTVDLYLWHDGGFTDTDNSGLIGAGGNLGAHFRWTRGPGFSIVCPLTGEWDIRLGDCGQGDAGNAFTVGFAFEMNQQVWAALGATTEGAGVVYAGAQEDDTGVPGIPPLNDADTWDIKAVATDSVHSAASPGTYDEFGTYMFTSMTSGGLPGAGYITGSGAPNTPNVALGPVGDWTFSANTDYDLYVHISDLTDGTQFIMATDIEIQGGEIGAFTNFLGAGVGNAQYLLGNSAAANGEGARPDGITTTTTDGATDGAGGGSAVTWRCDIPGVAESSYTGTITYVLEHDP